MAELVKKFSINQQEMMKFGSSNNKEENELENYI